jgi:hypothetical protein
MRNPSTLLAPALVLLSTVGCRGIDTAPVTAVLDASVALGLGASIAMTAIAGEGPDCVSMTPACTAAPCAARVEVTVGEACPLALGPAASGTVILDGEWTSETSATFLPDLTALDVGVGAGRVSLGLGLVLVDRDADEVEAVFVEQGVQTETPDGGSEVGVEQAGYTVRVTLAGTPADPTDDVLEISGGGQQVDAANGDESEGTVDQLAIALVVTDPSCRLNPVDGTATMSAVGDDEIEKTGLRFHSECDGSADVIASTADPTRIGDTIDLGYEP